MGYRLAAIGLFPLLIAEAVYVKRITPRLPEASGARSGIAGSGPSLNLLILGDSAAAGVGVASQRQALSGRLVSILGEGFRVSWKLIAQTGNKAKDTLAELRKLPPEAFNVVVTSIGVNDVTHGTGIGKWIGHQDQIIETLISKFRLSHIILSAVPPLHLFPALPQPLRWYLGMRAKQFNVALKKLAHRYRECEFVGIHFSTDESLMADDGFHPGAPAYSLWAEQVAAVIQSRLTGDDLKN